jgi:hypothetical protein
MQEELWIFSQLFLTSSIRGGCFVERLPEGCWFRRARVLSLMPETLESGGRVPEGTSSRIAESIEREFGFKHKAEKFVLRCIVAWKISHIRAPSLA